MTMHAEAHAKVNLGLRVVRRTASGMHEIRSLAQSIDWKDSLEVTPADSDRLEVEGAELPSGSDNLVWKAISLYREVAERVIRLDLVLRKEIPTASGLGGGSADAAAALLVVDELSGGNVELGELAPKVGADVPFCLVGGTAVVTGFGERVDRVRHSGGYCLALVVPPVELSAGAVYQAWDGIEATRASEEMTGSDLPPELREYAPLGNDLSAAAVALHPPLDDWRATLRHAWGRPVAMSGSGPTLFGYFADKDEAKGALAVVPPGARASAAAEPAQRGATITDR